MWKLIRDIIKRFVYRDVLRYPGLTVTNTGLPNEIPTKYLPNAQRTINDILIPLKERYKDIRVTSFYRSPEVNQEVGGTPESDHLRANAVDITSVVPFSQIGRFVRKNLNIRYIEIRPNYVHISRRSDS